MNERTSGVRHATWVLRIALLLCGIGLLGATATARAADRAIEDIRFMKVNGVARADIVLACPVRYLSHTAATGAEVQIRIGLERECLAELGGGLRSELYDPPSGNLAGVREVVFDTTVEDRVARLSIRLTRTARFTVSQGPMRNVLRVQLDPNTAVSEPGDLVPDSAPPAPPPPTRPRAAPETNVTEPATPRQPLRLVQRSAERAELFVIQLAAGPEVAAGGALDTAPPKLLYVNDRDIGGKQWQELRLGFFATENAAREQLAGLRTRFPDAVIALASIEEQDAAAQERRVSAVVQTAAPPASSEPSGALPELTPERIAALSGEANDAMLAANYDRAIQVYTRLLEEPAFAARAESRERLGVARERNGQLAQARHEYAAYLAEFPDGADADRVRQRLAGLIAVASRPRDRALTIAATESLWDVAGGIAQYYRRDLYRPLDELPDSTLHSALLSNVDLIVRRHGERFALLTRVDAAYRYNLLEPHESREPADQLYLTNAYVSVSDQRYDWSARVGRQSLHDSGVLGRFDGARLEYQWRPTIGLNLTFGSPVDYPRHAVDRHRQFASFSADIDEFLERWGFSFFGLLQDVDGIADRQTVGAEARFRGRAWSVIGAVDGDASYGVLNSVLVNANWRATDRLTLNGRVNVGAAPFIATRNALIGQTAGSIEELLGTYTEGQLRRLARDRTAQATDAALGLSWPVFDRYQLNVDFMYSEFGATVASAGVPALAASEGQSFVQATLVGSSILKNGDTAIFSLRHGDTRTTVTDTLILDLRLPSAQRLRLNPRIALTSRANVADGSEQWIAAPMLRMAFRWPNHHRFELELGGQWSDKDLPAPDPAIQERSEETSAYFVNAGYWWEF